MLAVRFVRKKNALYFSTLLRISNETKSFIQHDAESSQRKDKFLISVKQQQKSFPIGWIGTKSIFKDRGILLQIKQTTTDRYVLAQSCQKGGTTSNPQFQTLYMTTHED